MHISESEVARIAQLARLTVTPEEALRYAHDMTNILGYVERLEQLDTTLVEPTSHVTGHLHALRRDEVNSVSDEERAELIAMFPKSHAELLCVPPVFENYKE